MKTRTKIILLLIGVVLVTLAAYCIPTRIIGNGAFTSNKATLSTGQVKVFAIMGQTTNGSTQYIHVYDHIARMTNGGTPIFSFPVAANNYFVLDFGSYGADMDAVGVCNSTTAMTTTLGSTNTSFQAIVSGP
jgi:hypothetical protein